jgi:hypothetical protein
MKPALKIIAGGGGTDSKSTLKPAYGRRKRRKKGSLKELQFLLWNAIQATSDVVKSGETTPDSRVRAANSLAQLAYSYQRLDAYEIERPVAAGVSRKVLQGIQDDESKTAQAEPAWMYPFTNIEKPCNQNVHGRRAKRYNSNHKSHNRYRRRYYDGMQKSCLRMLQFSLRKSY